MISKLKQYPYLFSSLALLVFLSLFFPGAIFLWFLVVVIAVLWVIGNAIKAGVKSLKSK